MRCPDTKCSHAEPAADSSGSWRPRPPLLQQGQAAGPTYVAPRRPHTRAAPTYESDGRRTTQMGVWRAAQHPNGSLTGGADKAQHPPRRTAAEQLSFKSRTGGAAPTSSHCGSAPE